MSKRQLIYQIIEIIEIIGLGIFLYAIFVRPINSTHQEAIVVLVIPIMLLACGISKIIVILVRKIIGEEMMMKLLSLMPIIAFLIAFLITTIYFIMTAMTGDDRIKFLSFVAVFFLICIAIIFKVLKDK